MEIFMNIFHGSLGFLTALAVACMAVVVVLVLFSMVTYGFVSYLNRRQESKEDSYKTVPHRPRLRKCNVPGINR